MISKMAQLDTLGLQQAISTEKKAVKRNIKCEPGSELKRSLTKKRSDLF